MSVLREFTLAVDEGGGKGRGGGSSQAAARPARKDVLPPAPVGVGGQERPAVDWLTLPSPSSRCHLI